MAPKHCQPKFQTTPRLRMGTKGFCDPTTCRTSNLAGLYAVRAAYESTAIVDTHHQAALDAVIGNALRAHILASGDSRRNRIVELTRHAIRSWRDLAGLAVPSERSPRQADQPDRAAADRARLTSPAHRILADISQH